jgi:hypothetical protein
MTDNNVVLMPTPLNVLAAQLREDIATTIRLHDRWVDSMLRLAARLREARERFQSNNAFGHWLVDEAIGLSENDRACLIKMGEEPEIFRGILIEQTDALHANTIYRKYESRFGIDSKTTTEPAKPSEPPEVPVVAEKTETPPTSEAPVLVGTPDAKSAQPLKRTSPLFNLPRADEIAAIFLDANTRSLIGKAVKSRGGKAIWELVLTALDGGLLAPNSREFRVLTLNLLFPSATRGYVTRFDLTNQAQRKEIATKLLPAMIACRDQLFADPGNVQQIIEGYYKQRADETKAAAEEARIAKAMATLASGQQELRMFGKILWPRLDPGQGEYDYDQIRCAIWTFHDLDTWNEQVNGDNGVASRAIRIRLSTKWYSEYLLRNGRDNQMRVVFRLVSYLTRLFEHNPQGECKMPIYPLKEAEW